MAEHTLNAVVTLRNEVSPWLMVLQVVPDGWDLHDYVPGQFTSLGLLGSAPRCAIAEPENAGCRPGQTDQAGLLHRLVPGEPRVSGILRGPGAGRRPHAPPVQPEDRGPHLAFAKSGWQIHLRRDASAHGRQRGPDRHRIRPGAVHEHAEHPPEVPRHAPDCAHPRRATLVGSGLPVDPDGHDCTFATTSPTYRLSAGRRKSLFPGKVRRVMSRTRGRAGPSKRHGALARGRKTPTFSCAAAPR